MNGLVKMQAAVSVATVWTSAESPRHIDEPALQNPADIEGWISRLSIQDKLDLCDGNRVQTQMLLGAEVIVVEESGDWAKICIPEQSTRNNPLGYPGWVPKCQLAQLPDRSAVLQWAEVTSFRAILSLGALELELSFLTRLPLIEESDETVRVETPLGIGLLNRKDVRISSGPNDELFPFHTGNRIAEQAVKFIGLPYLWGGMSSFGFDCSGFAYQLHRSQGILIPRDASDQARHGMEIPRDRLEEGDLLFFARDEGKGHVHHVGIYTGDNCMIHSPDSRNAVEQVRLDEYKLVKEHFLSKRYWK
ncbi:C40 family peptidase [Paenibacillus radicis (ex Xue et al. 2023)]|uniref:C40 family peptidase n=1 Tax=Paenibacillus radicis (ex Xue et al. 2023) TaxID=2972489 RepID=A0ABT1YIL0_9BACL|nr:C40 family peptidase [Paenibacillus radicis (ex Xue et al. 2023)]MCR8633007.1 C40 family peptidase [Paenibacillus radicis (ex Xue et al. 2023)]